DLITVPPHIRFSQVIKHEPLAGKSAGEYHGGGQLPRVNKDVVGQTVALQAADAPQERRPLEESVGFPLDDVAQAEEPGMSRQPLELLVHSVRLQIHPA